MHQTCSNLHQQVKIARTFTLYLVTPLLLVNYQFEVPHGSLVWNVCKQIPFIHDKLVVNSLPISQSQHVKVVNYLPISTIIHN